MWAEEGTTADLPPCVKLVNYYTSGLALQLGMPEEIPPYCNTIVCGNQWVLHLHQIHIPPWFEGILEACQCISMEKYILVHLLLGCSKTLNYLTLSSWYTSLSWGLFNLSLVINRMVHDVQCALCSPIKPHCLWMKKIISITTNVMSSQIISVVKHIS